MIKDLWQDVRFGARVLMKNPAFTTVAVLVLGLGIGANAAIFYLVNAFPLRPMAVEKPNELFSCYNRNTKDGGYRAFSYPEYRDIRERNTVFTNVLAHDVAMVGVTEGDTTRRTFADIVSSNYFATFGVRMFQGRGFLEAEEQPGSAIPVAVVSYRYWERTGRDQGLVGKAIRINGRPYTVARRTREIGIRMALGASTRQVLRLVLREGLLLTGAGVLLGLGLALAAGKLLGSMLYEVSGTDPFVLSLASFVLALISRAACYLPARRAALVSPTTALRYE